MAEVLRYVRTSSTAGGDGTADTDSGATRAYPTLNAALAAEQTDLVSDGDTLRIVCSTGSGTSADATVVDVTGYTTGASNYIQIDGEFEGTTYSTSVYRVEGATAYGPRFDVDADYLRVNQVQIYNTNASNFQYACQLTRNASGDKDIRFNRCIFRLPASDTNGSCFFEGFGASATGTNKLELKNCLFLEAGQYNVFVAYSPGTTNLDMINCTAQNAGSDNLRTTNLNTVNLYNNLFDGAGTNDYVLNFNTTDNTGNNISGDATSPDGASWQNLTITYTDAGAQDYSFASSETDAYDTGVGNGSQSLVPTDSLNGVDRGTGSTCDVGCFEVAAAGGGATPKGPFGLPFHGPFRGPI
jgi:hypothetical protein